MQTTCRGTNGEAWSGGAVTRPEPPRTARVPGYELKGGVQLNQSQPNADSKATIRIALFGESGSGKTTFLSKYFGIVGSGTFGRQFGYDISCVDKEKGAELLHKYFDMTDNNTFPPSTHDIGRYYPFMFNIYKQPKPILHFEVSDYPGEWWNKSPLPPEANEFLASLLASDVGFLFIDGSKYLKHGKGYLCALFGSFYNAIVHMPPSLNLPKQWVLIISKCDLLEEAFSAKEMSQIVLSDPIVSDSLQRLSQVVGCPALGEDVLLLSSVKSFDGVTIQSVDDLGFQYFAPLSLFKALEKKNSPLLKALINVILNNWDNIRSLLIDIIERIPREARRNSWLARLLINLRIFVRRPRTPVRGPLYAWLAAILIEFGPAIISWLLERLRASNVRLEGLLRIVSDFETALRDESRLFYRTIRGTNE